MIDLQYRWNEETNTAIVSCETLNGEILSASAICHPDDADMCSRQTGNIIAEFRLLIKCHQYEKNNILRPQLKILYHLKSIYERDPNYNEYSYENKMLRKQIRIVEKEIEDTKEDIENIRKELKDFIDCKDSFYRKVRKHRGQNKLNNNKEISN